MTAFQKVFSGRVSLRKERAQLLARIAELHAVSSENRNRELYSRAIQLVNHYIDHYQQKSETHASISRWARGGMLLFGTVGVVLPLLTPIYSDDHTTTLLTTIGYVSLILAGTGTAIDNTFGGMSGHARYVKTRLELEESVSTLAAEWCDPKLADDPAADQKQYDLLLEFIQKCYDIIEAETDESHRSIAAAVQKQMATYKRK